MLWRGSGAEQGGYQSAVPWPDTTPLCQKYSHQNNPQMHGVPHARQHTGESSGSFPMAGRPPAKAARPDSNSNGAAELLGKSSSSEDQPSLEASSCGGPPGSSGSGGGTHLTVRAPQLALPP
jgi:hypothetical protein